MVTKEIAWDSTSTDKITISGTSFGGDQQISISSSENRKPADRSKDIVLSTSHTPRKSVTITVGQKRAVITSSLSISDISFTAAGGPHLVESTLSIFVNGNLAETKVVNPTFSYTSSWLTHTSSNFNAKSRGTVLGDALSTTVSASYTETSETYGTLSAQTQFVATQQANTRKHTSNLARFLHRGEAWVANPLEVSPKEGLVGMEGFYVYTYSSGSTKSEAVDIALDSFRSSADWFKVADYKGYAVGGGCSKQPNIAPSRSCQMWFEQAGFVSNKIDITQLESVATMIDYGVPVVTLAAPADIPAKGGSVYSGTVTYSQSRTQHYSNGNTVDLSDVTSGGSVSFNTVSANSLGTTVKARTQVGTLTATVSLNGKSGTASKPVYQQANATTTITYGSVIVRYSYPTAPASGGNISPNYSYSQPRTQNYTSGATSSLSALTSGGELHFDKIEGSATLNTSTGVATVASRGTTVDSANTTPLSAELIVTLNGKVGSSIASLTQTRNQATSITYGTPVVNVTAADVPAKGGSVTSGTATYSQSRTQNYTSTATSALSALTTGGTVTWSGGASNIASLGTTVKARTAVGSALVGKVTMNGKEGSKSVTVYQQANSATYGNLSGGSATASDIPASGGTRSASVTNPTQTVSFTSGSTRAGSVTSSQTAAISGSNLTSTVKARTKLGTITVTFSGEGSKNLTKTVDVYQAANSLTWNNPSITFTYADISAGGSTVTPSVRITQSGSYSSGSTASNTTINSKSFSGSSVNTSTGAVSASPLGATVKPRTKITTATVSVTANSKTATKTADVYQAANAQTLTSISIESYVRDSSWAPSLTTIPADGSKPAGIGVYRNYKYTSGSTSKALISDSSLAKSVATISVSWATAYGSSGGNYFSGVRCSAQTSSDTGARSGTVYVTVDGHKSNTLTFTQLALAANLRLSASTLSFVQRSTSQSIIVTSNLSYNVKK